MVAGKVSQVKFVYPVADKESNSRNGPSFYPKPIKIMEPVRNEFLWRKAKKRASFKIHLRTYLIVNAGLWLIYALSTRSFTHSNSFPWPLFPMFGWGIGLTSHYLSAYGGLDEKKLAEREYEKLIQQER